MDECMNANGSLLLLFLYVVCVVQFGLVGNNDVEWCIADDTNNDVCNE